MSAPSSDLGQSVEMVAWKLRLIMIQFTHDKNNLKLSTLGHHYLKSGEGDAGRTWKKKQSFVNPEILGMHIWRKERVNYNKFEIATNWVNQIFSSFSQMLHDITILFAY